MLLISPVAATPILTDGGTHSVTFDIIRHGETIGGHSLVFARRGGLTEVRIDISVKVTVFNLTAYRFEQHGTEIWDGNRLKTLNIFSDDDGNKTTVTAELAQGKLRTTVNGKTSIHPEMPLATLWRMVPPTTRVVLDPTDGNPTSISATDAGWETITIRGKPIRARHWVWDGELKRDLWYDAADALVQVRVIGDDGSEINYVLK
ncbi:MAG: DUF6134 family protein [Phaeospirillum sp.]|nr:DUF6134 family protein [Phaeospirillum sp.]